MEKFPEDSYYLQCMKTILDAYPQHSPPIHPTQLTGRLYIGNQDNADDVTLLTNLEITHVLNCAGTRNFDLTRSPYPPGSGIKAFLMIPAQDYDEFDIKQFFEAAIDFLDSAVSGGGKALVHCSIGVNRSGAVAAAYLMASQKKRLMDVIVELKAKRLLVLCNMGFRKQLVQFARENGLLDRVNVESAAQGRQVRPQPPAPLPESLESQETTKEEAAKEEAGRAEEAKQNGVHAGDGPQKNGTHETSSVESIKGPAVYQVPAKADDAQLYSKKYVYRTRTLLPESIATESVGSTLSSSKNYKNVDSDILVKLINESYDKYKRSAKMKETIAALSSAAPVAHSSSLALPSKSFAKKSSERELIREVEDFLSSGRVPTGRKSGDTGRLLGGIISREDERLIWGKSDILNDPEYLVFKDNLEKTTASLKSPQPSVGSRTKSLELLLEKYQDTTRNVVLRDLRELAEAPTKAKFASSVASTREPAAGLTSTAVDGQKRHVALSTNLPSRESTKEIFSRITSAKSSTGSIKPISYYRLQVMNEKNAKGPDLQQAASEYLHSTNGH